MNQGLHVHQCFQAVGHGTFFTGVIETDAEPGKKIFSWVYDCGAKSKTRVERVIADVDLSEIMPDSVDMFVLSHFDNDHVNGVEHFLRRRSVRWLARTAFQYS